jgi:predicted AAA+ superfamily ATPase
LDETRKLYDRAIQTSLKTALNDTPVVGLMGARQCGKSTLARALKPDLAYVSLDDETLLATARSDPQGFVAALPERVILDEVQRAPNLLRAIKLAVDRDRRPGRFLITGSANLLLLPNLGDSLAGRLEIVQLHPLTESEKERQAGGFLGSFLAGSIKPKLVGQADQDPADLPIRLVAGGYPEPLGRTPERARQWHRNYLRSLTERDARDVALIRDASNVARLLELLAHRTAELLNTSNLARDLGLHRETVEHYVAILERLFLIRLLPPWHRNDAKRLIKTPKVHLVDSGLAATLSGIHSADWITHRDRFGHLLESFVVQQIIAQAGWTDPDLRFWHYRDKDQIEVDLVVTRGREVWGIEVKASATVTSSDGHGLRRLADQCGKDFRGGALLYSGSSTFALTDSRIVAVPLNKLWNT